MIEYIIPENPDDRVLRRASYLLNNNDVICFPTDTNWVLAAAIDSKKGIDLLYKLKGEDQGKHFSIMCSSISQASKYSLISDFAFRKINRKIPGPYTFIFNPSKDLPKAIKSYRKEKQIGIRIPSAIFCKKLLEFHGDALVTTSITSMTLEKKGYSNTYGPYEQEIYSYQIEDAFSAEIKMILDPGDFHFIGPSTVVDFSNGDDPSVLRKGAGDVSGLI